MSVPVWRRSVSSKEYLYHFYKIRKEIISLLYADFGINEKDIVNIPNWIIEIKRQEIMKSLARLNAYLNSALSINLYTENTEEKEMLKKELLIIQNKAIQECFILFSIIQECSEIFPVKKGRYVNIGHALKEEVTYIKYWKKSFRKQDI